MERRFTKHVFMTAWRRMSLALLLLMLTTVTAWADDVNLSEDPYITVGTAGHYYVNMPSGSGTVTNSLEITTQDITDGKGTFKVYDNGGKGGQYSTNCTGILVLTAPENYVIQLSGDIYTETNWDKLTVYDNNEASGTTLLNEKSSSDKGVKTSIGTIISSANVMTIKFSSDGSGTYDGLDLTVTLISTSQDYNINVNTATGGSISASVGGNNATTAKVADVVTLTATPDNAYVLSGISVTDASSNPVAVTWDGPFSNTATFTMPASVVTVTPTFSNNISINMPTTNNNYNELTIPSGVQSFKVYDDGGKDDKYSNNYEGTLVLTAPEGHKIRLSGSITLESYDKLTVYNGSKESGTKLLDAVSSSSSGTKTDITTFTSTGDITSTGNVMTIYFKSDGSTNFDGLDLTVMVFNPNADYNVTINTAEGGSVTANPTSAKVNETVTLTATPDNTYVLSGISVTDASSNPVAVTGGKWYDNTATFTMPGSVATVTPTFSDNLTAAGGLYINMPVTGDQIVEIPAGVESFKVYDDGGKDGNYSQNCTGTLVLTAPEGYVLQLSGSVTLDYNNEKLTVYNGTKANDDKLIDAFSCSESDTKTDIPMATSKGNVMTIYFETNNFYEYAGLDLTVTVVSTSTDYTINGLGSATGGSISASVGGENATTAKANDVVTLTATPENGYLLGGISVTDASSNPVVVTGGKWYDNTATFTMPGSVATVTPTFTDDMTDLSVNMPVTGDQIVEIPAGVESFKVYDDGGKDNVHSQNCTGTLVLTAPENHLLRLSGKITTDAYDYLTVYDGSKENGSKLLNEVRSTSGGTETGIKPVTSKGNVMTIYFYTNNFYEEAGLDLTVTVVNPNTEYNVNVINPAEGGSVTASPTSAKVNETVTLTATPASGYLLSGISVTDAGSNPVAVTWDGPFFNIATFTMPGSNVTVTPTFTDNLTADNGLYINMPTTNNNYNELTIPSGVQSFKVYDDGGENGTYSNNYEGTLVLTAPEGYVLQLSGGITTESSDKLTVYDNSEASGTKLIDAMGGSGSTKKDIEPVTSSGNAMTIYFKSDYSVTYAGLDLTVTLFKNIAACDITVPNQTLEGPNNPFDNISYKFEYVNTSDGRSYATKMGIIVKDGDNTLTLGTDYTFGSVKMANGDPIQESAIGDECKVEIVGKGNYAGSKWETFKIVAPDANGTWGDLTWAFHDGTLTISPTENVPTPVAMKEANAGDYLWFSSANYIQTITIEEGVSTVANNAFNRVTESNVYGNVTTVNLPSTLTTIGDNAFAFCTGATITIPTSVTTLGANPFNQVRCVEISKPLVDGNDNSDLISKIRFAQSATFTYNRSFTENVASTVCLPFDYTPSSEGTYYTFTAINKETSPWTVTMTATAASLTANTPYMFMPAATGEVSFSGTASSFNPSNVQVNDPKVDGGKWNLIGTYESRLWNDTHNTEEIGSVYGFAARSYNPGSYTVNPGDFVKAAAGASIAPFRAYLKYTAPVSNAPRRGTAEEALPSRMSVRLVNADGDVTAIGAIDTKTGEIRFDSEAWYTLDGRRLNGKPSVKGMYINNGRKIIVK